MIVMIMKTIVIIIQKQKSCEKTKQIKYVLSIFLWAEDRGRTGRTDRQKNVKKSE